MTPHFVFPADPLNPRKPDETFRDQIDALRSDGFGTSVVSLEENRIGLIPGGATVVYRGWMLNDEEYQKLLRLVERSGGNPCVNREAYLLCHHLPKWYPVLEGLTPDTRVFSQDHPNLASELKSLGWSKFFVKDYVKSLKTSIGSAIVDPAQVETVLSEMRKYRGTIEGGVCVRRFENLVPDSEKRYFVIRNRPHAASPDAPIPDIAIETARRIMSPFFSVDIARHEEGKFRVIEVGDGQVSDLVGWTPERFAQMWKETTGN